MRVPSENANSLKPLRILDAARSDLLDMPDQVQHDFGYGLYLVQRGEMPANASPFEGATGANIIKLVERYDTDTYRCVFTAKFEKAVYVLHVFQKKSPSGISTPQRDIELVQARFRRAQALYKEEFETEPPNAEQSKPKAKKDKQ